MVGSIRTTSARVPRIRRTLPVAVAVLALVLVGCSTGPVGGLGPNGPTAPPTASSSAGPDPRVSDGGRTPPPVSPTSTPTVTVAPAPPAPPACTSTTMSVWAHPDDDLLFLQGMIADHISAGECVRTVFLTSGDAGRPADYWTGREAGIMRAYDVMRGRSTPWQQQSLSSATGAQTVVWQPADDPRLSIVFFHLPDGNLNGQGYPGTGEVSLAKLAADKIPALSSVGGAYRLNWGEIVESLRELIASYAPTTFYTHVPGSAQAWAKGDHADHAITGILARKAWQSAGVPESAVAYAVGYQTVNYPANLSGDVLTRKLAAFRAYAAGDAVVAGCVDDATCLALPRFGGWLQRQYSRTEAELWQ